MDEKTYNLIQEINAYHLSLMKPKHFSEDDKMNHIRGMERSFEAACNALEELGVTNPHSLTTFQFYSKIRYFKEKKKPQQSKRR